MNLPAIIARIQSQCPAYASVSGGLDLFRAISNAPVGIHAWVALASESANEPAAANFVQQRISAQFAVLTLVRADPADDTGIVGYQTLQTARDELFAALIGYQPESHSLPITQASGSLSELDNGFLLWEDTFNTEFFRSQV